MSKLVSYVLGDLLLKLRAFKPSDSIESLAFASIFSYLRILKTVPEMNLQNLIIRKRINQLITFSKNQKRVSTTINQEHYIHENSCQTGHRATSWPRLVPIRLHHCLQWGFFAECMSLCLQRLICHDWIGKKCVFRGYRVSRIPMASSCNLDNQIFPSPCALVCHPQKNPSMILPADIVARKRAFNQHIIYFPSNLRQSYWRSWSRTIPLDIWVLFQASIDFYKEHYKTNHPHLEEVLQHTTLTSLYLLHPKNIPHPPPKLTFLRNYSTVQLLVLSDQGLIFLFSTYP